MGPGKGRRGWEWTTHVQSHLSNSYCGRSQQKHLCPVRQGCFFSEVCCSVCYTDCHFGLIHFTLAVYTLKSGPSIVKLWKPSGNTRGGVFSVVSDQEWCEQNSERSSTGPWAVCRAQHGYGCSGTAAAGTGHSSSCTKHGRKH